MSAEMNKKDPVRMKEMIVTLPGNHQLSFLVAEDIEELITDLSDEDKVPCWADIWPAAHGLSYYLWEKSGLGADETVMELGAGMGLPGIVCALKGADVTLSDFNPTALEMAAENARRNNLKVALLQDDWRSFQCRERFDLLLASDILYDPKLNPFLGRIFTRNLKPRGTIYIAHPDRKATREFVENCREYGLQEKDRQVRVVELPGSLLTRYNIVINLLQADPRG